MADNPTIAVSSGDLADTAKDIKQKAKLIGRWVASFSAAIIAAFVAQFIFGSVDRITLIFIGVNPDGLLVQAYVLALSAGMVGAAFVYAGAWVAPTSQHTVAMSLAGLALFLMGACTLASLLMRDYWGIWHGFFCALGASVTSLSILENT